MQIQHLKRLTFVVIVLAICSVRPASATENDITHSILSYAEAKYDQGDRQAAFLSFLQALVLNPHNQEAQKGILSFISNSRLRSAEKINLIRLQDLLNYSENLQYKIQYYEHKISEVEPGIIQSSVDKGVFFKEKQAFLAAGGSPGMAAPSDKLDSAASDPLEFINMSLSAENDQLLHKLSSLQKYFEYLRMVSRKRAIALDLARTAVTDIEINARKTRGGDESDLAYLKREFANLRQQVVDLTLQLSEKDIILSKQQDSIASFNDQFLDLQSRFALGEKIMAEKDAQIQTLQKDVKKIQLDALASKEELNNILLSKDQKIFELNGILQIYKGKLIETTQLAKEKKASATTLEDQLEILQARYVQKSREIQKAKHEIVAIQDAIEHIQEQVTDLKKRHDQIGFSPSHTSTEIEHLQTSLTQISHYLETQLESINKAVPFAVHD